MMIGIAPQGGGYWTYKFGAWQGQGATLEDAKAQVREKSHKAVYAHELAHKQAAGRFGGAISLTQNGDGITVAGSVPVHMPTLNVANPQETLAHAKTVMAAALAPDSLPTANEAPLSDADHKVHAQAQAVYFQAQQLLQQKKAQQGPVFS
ncbi:MAG: hypothetical protein ACKO37_07415 [Vampirovibrionales bacterium]